MKAKLILMLAMMTAFSACGPVVEEEQNPNPMIRSDFSTKYAALLSALQGSLRQNQLWISDNEFRYLEGLAVEARDHSPISGLVLQMRFDDYDDENQTFSLPAHQPLARISRIRSWQICSSPYNLRSVDLEIGKNDFSVSPSPQVAYQGIRAEFDYGARSPQYDLSDNQVASRSQISNLVSPFRQQGCKQSRQIIEYAIYSQATMDAISSWKSRMNGIIVNLNNLRSSRSNGQDLPEVSLEQVVEKLKSAYFQLP